MVTYFRQGNAHEEGKADDKEVPGRVEVHILQTRQSNWRDDAKHHTEHSTHHWFRDGDEHSSHFANHPKHDHDDSTHLHYTTAANLYHNIYFQKP